MEYLRPADSARYQPDMSLPQPVSQGCPQFLQVELGHQNAHPNASMTVLPPPGPQFLYPAPSLPSGVFGMSNGRSGPTHSSQLPQPAPNLTQHQRHPPPPQPWYNAEPPLQYMNGPPHSFSNRPGPGSEPHSGYPSGPGGGGPVAGAPSGPGHPSGQPAFQSQNQNHNQSQQHPSFQPSIRPPYFGYPPHVRWGNRPAPYTGNPYLGSHNPANPLSFSSQPSPPQQPQQAHQQPLQTPHPPQPPQQPSQMPSSGDRPGHSQPGPSSGAPQLTLPSISPFPNHLVPPASAMPTRSSDPSPEATQAPQAPQAPQAFPRRVNPAPASSTTTTPPRRNLFNPADLPRAEGGPHPSAPTLRDALREVDAGIGPSNPMSIPAAPANTDRRHGHRGSRIRRGASSEDDSDEDLDPMDDENETMAFLEQYSIPHAAFRGSDNEDIRIRAQQLLRGQLSNKRVASKRALSQLQSVDIKTLDEGERCCVICYNDFGTTTPEGMIEAPLRLPNCKHVFGDHCIKKWFEESDSCPYCRDKVHSEPAYAAHSRALQQFLQSYNNSVRYNGGRENRTGPNGTEPYVRILTGAIDRYDNGTRAWPTGGRRSPPSDSGESRRRTRPRHGSFRGSPTSTTGSGRPTHQSPGTSAAPSQMSPRSERFMGMPGTPRTFNPSVRPPMPPTSHSEQNGLNAPSMHGQPPIVFGSMTSYMDAESRYRDSFHGRSDSSATETSHLPGPAQLPYSHQLAVNANNDYSIRSISTTDASPSGDWLQ